MLNLVDFYTFCQERQIDVIPFANAPSAGATIRDGWDYAIFLDFTKIHSTRLLKAVCAHELGHAATGALHKLDSPFESVERSEYRAGRWVAENVLTQDAFQEAFGSGCREIWEFAEYFDFPEDDVKNALAFWTERRGIDFSKKITGQTG